MLKKTIPRNKRKIMKTAAQNPPSSKLAPRKPRVQKAVEPQIIKDPIEAAEAAGLNYVHDDAPGIRRKKRGAALSYIDTDGKAMRDRETLKRIRSLAIPPAYRDVWICPNANGHLQATGIDDRNRKQYRYHLRWRAVRDENKYARMMAFGRALPSIRERTNRDLAQAKLSRERVCAALVQLLEKPLIRVGNQEYSKTNKSYGLTTMRNRHVKVEGAHVRFEFKGKSGVRHAIDLNDRRLARVVERISELPGQEVFQYVDEDGARHSIGSTDVNAYLKEITEQDFSAKDFRTWAGTVLASLALQEFEKFDSETQAKKNIVAAIEHVSKRLGNTPSICRKCYIHPAVLDSYLDGTMLETLTQRAEQDAADFDLRPEEAAVMGLLQNRLHHEQRENTKAAA